MTDDHTLIREARPLLAYLADLANESSHQEPHIAWHIVQVDVPAAAERITAALDRLVRERDEAREALRQVRHACLMNIRRAAFGPEIGVRYTEVIRAEIGNECWKLEQFIDRFLAAQTDEPRG